MRNLFYPSKEPIPGLLPSGLIVLGGQRQVGKSWLGLYFGLCIATETAAFEKYPVEQGEVLYLALEETQQSLQERLGHLGTPSKNRLEQLEVSLYWPRIDTGGSHLLEEWLCSHPNARLIIIDTWTKVKPRPSKKQSHDVRSSLEEHALETLKRLAERYSVCILLHWHVNKEYAKDIFDENRFINSINHIDGSMHMIKEKNAEYATLYETGYISGEKRKIFLVLKDDRCQGEEDQSGAISHSEPASQRWNMSPYEHPFPADGNTSETCIQSLYPAVGPSHENAISRSETHRDAKQTRSRRSGPTEAKDPEAIPAPSEKRRSKPFFDTEEGPPQDREEITREHLSSKQTTAEGLSPRSQSRKAHSVFPATKNRTKTPKGKEKPSHRPSVPISSNYIPPEGKKERKRKEKDTSPLLTSAQENYSHKKWDSTLPALTFAEAERSWFLYAERAYYVREVPTSLFQAAILSRMPSWQQSETYGPILMERELDLIARWWLLCALSDVGMPFELYTSQEEALRSMSVGFSHLDIVTPNRHSLSTREPIGAPASIALPLDPCYTASHRDMVSRQELTMEYLTIAEAARRLGSISDKTIRRAIAAGKLAAHYPHPNKAEVSTEDLENWYASLHVRPGQTQNQMAALEARVTQLESEVKELRYRLEASVPAKKPPPTPATTAPSGFLYLSDFCRVHAVPYQAAANLFPRAIHGQKIKVQGRLQPMIGPRGRHDFYVQLHTRADFRTCDDCPHEMQESGQSV